MLGGPGEQYCWFGPTAHFSSALEAFKPQLLLEWKQGVLLLSPWGEMKQPFPQGDSHPAVLHSAISEMG